MSIEKDEGEHPTPQCPVLIAAVLIILFVVSSGCIDLTNAYIPDTVLNDGWYENTSLRNSGSQFLGLEKWASATYEIKGNYPASLTVTTMKTLVLMDEQELQDKTKETITSTLKEGINLNESTETIGERYLLNTHKTMYITYDGIDISGESHKKMKIIGEISNCATSGTSIICIGTAYLTNNNNSSSENVDNWAKIVMDDTGTIENLTGKNGLIFNAICCD